MSRDKPIKILIADDHRLFREGLVSLLKEVPEIEVVGDAPSGKAAIFQVGELKPDVVLMDLEMPELDGIDAIRVISHKFPGVKILVLTCHEDDNHICQAMRGGASGYAPKRIDRDELVRIIKSVNKGDVLLSPFLENIILKRSGGRKPEEACGNDLFAYYGIALTAREKNVLELIARGCTNDQIAKTIHVSRDTVKATLKSIYRKLQVKRRTEAAVEALRRGIV